MNNKRFFPSAAFLKFFALFSYRFLRLEFLNMSKFRLQKRVLFFFQNSRYNLASKSCMQLTISTWFGYASLIHYLKRIYHFMIEFIFSKNYYLF